MMTLKENQVCPYSHKCKYNLTSVCWGAKPNRNSKFTCTYVKDGVFIKGNKPFTPLDETGNMQIIMEGSNAN